MLNDLKVRAFTYDGGADEVRLEVGDEARAPSGAARTVEGQLLLDAAGFLVGVDLGGDGLSRAVAMLGPHETVDRAVPASLTVHADATGTAVMVVVKRTKDATWRLPPH
jgi:hypothetical protein